MKTERSNKSYTMLSVALGVIILAGVLCFIYFLGQSTTKETEVVLSDTSVEIKGMFSTSIDYEKISSVELKDNIPAIGEKTNGSAIGEVCKGNFMVDGLGECKLYILSSNGPFLYIKADGKYVIINYKDKGTTEKLYDNLLAIWKNG
jgi:hypothetical protein